MNKSESVAELSAALCKARLEMITPIKDKSGYGYKYVDLGQILDICVPVLCKHNIFLTQPVSFEEGRVVIETSLMLGNEFMSEQISLPVLQAKGMNEVQCIGSTITYGRRYALSSMLGIGQEDTDAAELRVKTVAPTEPVINSAQVDEITSMAEESMTDLSRITSFFKIGYIEELPASKYIQVIKRLKTAKEQSS